MTKTISLANPIGRLTFYAMDDRITGLDWTTGASGDSTQMLDRAVAQLAEYFAGTRQDFDLPLAPRGGAVQLDFYAALRAIPYGQTRTYGDLAKRLGVSAQAIGQACGANPIPILIPCHRVLAATGLGGYSGAGGVEAKVALLKLEGAASLLI